MSEWSEEEITQAVEKVCKQAAADPKFHAMALSDPHGAIQAVAGKPVPAGKTVRFVALEGADFCFVLPDPQKDGELSDADLESVAGGRCKFSSISVGYCR